MTRRSNTREDQLRRTVAHEAARIMAEQGIDDFLLAKRKAAERLHISNISALPKNTEIEAALIEYQRLFQSQHHERQLYELRHVALHLMQLLHDFRPRLVGSVLSGSATAHTEINLHVFVDRAEQIVMQLEEHGIQPHHAEKKVRYEPDRVISCPSFKFIAGQQAVEIVVFPLDGIRQSPSSPVDGRPMPRADIEAVADLLK
ncbi:MAG: hypothetical protein AB7T07_12360 [Steroidobacteraceae bacterium]